MNQSDNMAKNVDVDSLGAVGQLTPEQRAKAAKTVSRHVPEEERADITAMLGLDNGGN